MHIYDVGSVCVVVTCLLSEEDVFVNVHNILAHWYCEKCKRKKVVCSVHFYELLAIDLVKWMAIGEKRKQIGFWRNKFFIAYFVWVQSQSQCIKCVKKCYEEGRCVFKEKFRWQMVSSMRFLLSLDGDVLYRMLCLEAKASSWEFICEKSKVNFVYILFCRRKSELCEHAAHHCNGRLACSGQDLHCKKAFSVPELDWNQYKR